MLVVLIAVELVRKSPLPTQNSANQLPQPIHQERVHVTAALRGPTAGRLWLPTGRLLVRLGYFRRKAQRYAGGLKAMYQQLRQLIA